MTNVSIMSSAEQYFRAGVLKEKSDISAGLGLPDPTLAGCLAVCWLLLYLTLRNDLILPPTHVNVKKIKILQNSTIEVNEIFDELQRNLIVILCK